MKQKLVTLTEQNYYSPENDWISNSKVSDFLRSKRYFYEKHIEHSIADEDTPSMMLGRMVDLIFSAGSVAALEGAYKIKDARGEKQVEGGPVPVTLEKWNQAIEMGLTLITSNWYSFYHTPGLEVDFQKILTGYVQDGKKKIGVCGKTDMFAIDHANKVIYIDDLKTAALGAIRNSTTWFWHCHEFGYFRQLWHYKNMAAALYPEYKVITRHAVLSSGKDGVYKTKLFIIPEHLLREPGKQFTATVKAIAKEKKFADPAIGWENAETMDFPVSYKHANPMKAYAPQQEEPSL